MSDATDKAAAHWNGVTQSASALRTRWWQIPRVLMHINKLVCDEPLSGAVAGDVRRLLKLGGKERFRRGISVGCGAGQKELLLVQAGVVERFDLYEIASERVRIGRELVAKAGLSERVTFRQELVDFSDQSFCSDFDLVYWNNALHHMLDTRLAVAWSKGRLRPGGCLYMNDYVGPNRMQFDDAMLDLARSVRELLPDRLLADPRHEGRFLARNINRPNREAIIASDPTECADSEAIIPALHEYFPLLDLRLTGGAVYHLALNDVFHNFVPGADDPLLDALMLLDAECARNGMTQYGVALGEV